VVDQNAPVALGVENLVSEHHQSLVMNLDDIGVAGTGCAGGIEFSAFDLNTEVQGVLSSRNGTTNPLKLASSQVAGSIMASNG
jgi:hypothetical protein